MSSSDFSRRSALRLALAAMAALPLAACFKPVYGERAMGGGNAQSELQRIRVSPINGRAGQIMRNELVFGLSGGLGDPAAEAYTLTVSLTSTSAPMLVDGQSGRPTTTSLQFSGTYVLTDKASGRELTKGYVASGATFDQSTQRYAGSTASQEASERAAKVMADQVVTHVASYFATRR